MSESPAGPILIVGTGRCGSTLLSHMIRQHPTLASISEVFSFVTDLGTRIERAFPQHALTGTEFWNIFAQPQPRQNLLLQHGLQMDEILYPFGRGRFDRSDIPPAALAMAPLLAPDAPDELFDLWAQQAVHQPNATPAVHYRRFFDRIAALENKETWVERSGGSLRVVERLLNIFPDAKYVHLVRDGRDTAISMSRHVGFKMALLCGMQTEMLGIDPYESDIRDDERDLSDELACLLPENFTRQKFLQLNLPPALFGHYWSGEIRCGLDSLRNVEPERLLVVKYEELLAKPEECTERLARFLTDDVCGEWLEQAAAMVRYQPPRWPQLTRREITELNEVCRPGFEALAADGIRWENI